MVNIKDDNDYSLDLLLHDKNNQLIFLQTESIPKNCIIKQFKFHGYTIRIEKRNV